MSITRKILAAAIVGGLFAGSAQAAVDISGPAATNPAVRIASEAVIPAAGLAIANVGNELDLVTQTGYSFSAGEVRYARFECSPHMEFTTGTTALTPPGNGILGGINGLGTNAISFSITADAITPVVAANTIAINGTRTVSSKDPVSCSYGLYDTPSQAQAGGTTGRIVFEQGAYLVFADSYAITTTPNVNVADVEAIPSFSEYVGGGTLAKIGHFDLSTVALAPLNPTTGVPITLPEILGGGTEIILHGDFSVAETAPGSFDLTQVFFGNSVSCGAVVQLPIEVTASTAIFEYPVGSHGYNVQVCLEAGGGVAIPAADYTVALEAESADATKFVARDLAAQALGKITRNGTELQAPLAQVPAGWISRMVLTNTGSDERAYTIAVTGETGNVISASNLTGTVPANGTVVVELNDVLTGFTAAQRATLNVNVAGPNTQIQGLYQIVNPASGSISNHAMLRPGTN